MANRNKKIIIVRERNPLRDIRQEADSVLDKRHGNSPRFNPKNWQQSRLALRVSEGGGKRGD